MPGRGTTSATTAMKNSRASFTISAPILPHPEASTKTPAIATGPHACRGQCRQLAPHSNFTLPVPFPPHWSLRPRDDRGNGVAYSDVPRITGKAGAALARNVAVTNAGLRVGEPHRAAGAGGAECLLAAKVDERRGFHEAQRELHAIGEHAFVVEAARRRRRGGGQGLERSRVELQVAAAVGE